MISYIQQIEPAAALYLHPFRKAPQSNHPVAADLVFLPF
ncbi:hypothetical protein KNP414_00775 [Paenibacillus mucilaginosus KNP414]|uniref:Uncharacterized protein n=1 Tax=Paenibacillus mucilaginosus (strain KNP414) TaxID=1036673 RepID=F8FRB5_PAEMK|nr:hypothetical protein KNP414_00775 [Paenibacillus mucilaginosus KNP414]